MSRLEIREELCRELIARAEGGDKQADVDLQVLAIDFLEDVIAGRDDAAAPGALLRYVRDELERSLPHDKDRLRADRSRSPMPSTWCWQKLPDIRATRNQASRTAEHPESACSLVAKALANVGRAMSENNVQKAWEAHGVCRRANS